MSIIKKRFSAAAIIFAAMTLLTFVVEAQDLDAKIKITNASNVRVEGKFINRTANQSNVNWSFLSSTIGAENLGSRISAFQLTDRQGQSVSVKQLAAGEFLAEAEAENFQYQINLSSLPNIKSKAHVSWLDDEQGILMLDDLLPQFLAEKQTTAAKIQFELPAGWKVFSVEKKMGENTFEIKNVEKAIFVVGKNWREREVSSFNLIVSGEWRFSDAEAANMVRDITEEYRKLFGELSTEKVQITLARFPPETKFGRWEAETRGANLTILSSDMPFKTLSAQRLHEQLRHEVFHLWIPNNLALTGNYDWFYEGFTVYQALRTGVAANQIRFEDFLSTLAEAYRLDNFQTQKISLVDSSKNRWNSANSPVYSRGMLIAFLCDLAILKQSKGARSINNLFQEIYRRHRAPNKPLEANTAILNVLKSYAELDSTIEKYVTGTNKINWKTALESVGIEASEENSFVKLSVKAKLSGKQKDLLNKLGYNNWRKISAKAK